MISCTQFIPAYSEGFKYLEKKDGKKKVNNFWEYLSDLYLEETLKKQVIEKGLKGCFDYWAKALNEEAADFTMTLDEDNNKFEIQMHKCPSKGMLNDINYMQPYDEYCKHCIVLYKRVLNPLGYKYKMDLSDIDQAKCRLTINKKKKIGGSKNG